jgi:hypothetical protein
MVFISVVAPAKAQETPPPPCSSEEYRAFDFWIGEWEVEANGKPAGRSHVSRILDGCVIYEEWESYNGGFVGKSFNRYDRVDGLWHQTWVDNQGSSLDLAGTREGNTMILEGASIGSGGESVLNRITWIANEDGTVRQVWESSRDDGLSWATIFDGLYRPAGS